MAPMAPSGLSSRHQRAALCWPFALVLRVPGPTTAKAHPSSFLPAVIDVLGWEGGGHPRLTQNFTRKKALEGPRSKSSLRPPFLSGNLS